MLANPWRWEF